MKIIVATSRPFHLVHLSRELAAIGHDVTVYGYMPASRIKHYNPGGAKYVSLFARLLPDSALALQAQFPTLQKYATERLFSSVDEQVVSNMTQCDVFIGLSGVICKSFEVAKKKFGAVTICDRGSSHVLTQQSVLTNQATSRLSNEYVSRELGGYTKADYVTVPSLYSEQSFIQENFEPRRLFVNNYGVDLRRFRFNGPAVRTIYNKRLLFVGGWCYQKGVDIFAGALASDPTLQITHIGTPGDIPFPDSPRFKSLGRIPNDQLFEHYANHDVFILPSRQDGFGMVLLEALACGTPVIASYNTGAPDIKKISSNPQSVTLMEDVSTESLIAALDTLNRHTQTIPSELLSENEQMYFSWSKYGHRYSEFLSTILN